METSKPEIYRPGGAQRANVIPLENISVSEVHIFSSNILVSLRDTTNMP